MAWEKRGSEHTTDAAVGGAGSVLYNLPCVIKIHTRRNARHEDQER